MNTAQSTQGRLDSKETEEVIRIMTRYFKKETGSLEKANAMVNEVAEMIKQPAAKLVHLGDTVFLLLVKDRGVVEFHTMRDMSDSLGLAKDIKALAKYAKNIGVEKLYSYSTDNKFNSVAKRTRLPWEISETTGADGKDYTVYTLMMENM